MTKYTNYKDSGIEWLGEVPEHWELRKVAHLFRERKEKVSDKDFEALSVTMQGILPQLDSAAKTNDGDNRKKVCKGDFVINSRSDRKGSSGISPYDGSVSLINIVLKPFEVDEKFIGYLLKTYYFKEEFFRYGKGIVWDLWTTRFDDIKNMRLPYPKFTEQTTIANFLDHKCAQIDRFISKKQELIARLEEKKQAVINQAVTKGLDPTVKMKPSGVEWLGDVPEHWEVRKLKFLIKGKLKYGANESGIAFREDYPRYIRITDFGKGGELSDENKLSLEPEKAKDYILKDGDILLARSGATVGKAYQFKGNDLACYAGYLIKAEADESIILSDFLYAYTKSKAYDSWKSFIYSKATIENISADKYAYLIVCYPNIEEQKRILEIVQEETSEINTAITRINEEITLIEEYKNALISEAVTGKIDVRAWQAKNLTQAT